MTKSIRTKYKYLRVGIGEVLPQILAHKSLEPSWPCAVDVQNLARDISYTGQECDADWCEFGSKIMRTRDTHCSRAFGGNSFQLLRAPNTGA